MYLAGSKKWDPSTEPELGVECFFSFPAKLHVIFSEVQCHFDWVTWLLRAFIVILQRSEVGENGKMDVFQVTHSHISEAPPRALLSSWALWDVGRSIYCRTRHHHQLGTF